MHTKIMINYTTYKFFFVQRPWYDLENSAQIMFKVGMGGKPQIPDTLSAEGKDFLGHCFMSDPPDRYTAAELLDHPFVKVSYC